jgi:signal transduction histidine kinase
MPDDRVPAADALRVLVARLASAQEAERHALARALHDDIGQQLAAIKLGAMALQDETDPAARAELVDEIIAAADQTVVALRELSARLRPPQLDALGLEAALHWQAERLFRDGPRLDLALAPLPRRPGPAVELACLRIAEEAMTNALRHAQAGTVAVALSAEGGNVLLEVSDDGRGFDPLATRGSGLLALHERAAWVGGEVDVQAAPGAGTRVRARIPFAG